MPNYHAALRSSKRMYAMKDQVIIRWMLHGNISQNGYGNSMIGRYGGCFEKDIMWLMCERAYRLTGFGCTDEVGTTSRGEIGQCMVPKRLENIRI